MDYIFQKLDLLSPEDFAGILAHKDTVVNKGGEGGVRINEQGEIYIESDHTHVYQGSVLNYQLTIEGFEPYFGKPFTNLMEHVRAQLIENGSVNPRPYSARCYRNDGNIFWHRHTPPVPLPDALKGSKIKNLWATLYYMHPNWNVNSGGELKIGLIEEEHLFIAPCYSNSLVAHNLFYGHTVDNVVNNYEGHRDLFLSHWVCD